MKSTHESEIVLKRFEEICPRIRITGMGFKDILEDVHVAFEIIGYHPRNLEKSVQDAIDECDHDIELYLLCYHAWRSDI